MLNLSSESFLDENYTDKTFEFQTFSLPQNFYFWFLITHWAIGRDIGITIINGLMTVNL